MPEIAAVLAIASLALLSGAIAGWVSGSALLRQAGPVATRAALARMDQLALEWEAWRKGAEGVLEAIEDVEQVIERKRRRVAARESASKAANGAEPDPNSREALIARARAQGHPV